MLTSLTIKNYALIDTLKVDFDGAFNIITGETGAGKSIILGALGLILGKRADLSSLRDKNQKCVVEGIFNVESYGLADSFEKFDLDYEHVSIFRREITPSGKSRAFINDTPVNLTVMQQMASRLIDIHSQHQSLDLGNQIFQLRLVDIVAGVEKELKSYSDVFVEFNNLKTKLGQLKEKAGKEKSELDYLEFQWNQLEESKLVDGEQEQLEEEQEFLSHAEEIKSIFSNLQNILEGNERSLLSELKSGVGLLTKAGIYLKDAEALAERLESSYLELKDISEDVERISENTDVNPQQLEFIKDRLDLLYSLQQKHHVSSIKKLIDLKNNFEKQIGNIAEYDDEISKLEKRQTQLNEQLHNAAQKLTKKRQDSFQKINKDVKDTLQQLGMPHARFQIELSEKTDFTPTGKDEISFLFSANRGGEMDEISKVASGGETSRLMLALKTIIATKNELPTIIFDEIDSGISGEIALKMGNILKEFSKHTQLINITHLPQIAGKGDAHFVVYKEERSSGTFTSIRRLNEDERVVEIASLLSGENPSESALHAAKELINN